MIGLLVGIPIGIATSLAAWYILFHIIAPRVEFLPSVFKAPAPETPSGWKYLVKFRNNGARDALDLELFAKVRIRGFATQRANSWRAIYVSIDDPRIPKVPSHRGTARRFVVVADPCAIPDSAKTGLPPELQSQCEDGTLGLEDLLNLGSQATFQVFAFAYDAFSGARKLFESPAYTIDDIVREVADAEYMNHEINDMPN